MHIPYKRTSGQGGTKWTLKTRHALLARSCSPAQHWHLGWKEPILKISLLFPIQFPLFPTLFSAWGFLALWHLIMLANRKHQRRLKWGRRVMLGCLFFSLPLSSICHAGYFQTLKMDHRTLSSSFPQLLPPCTILMKGITKNKLCYIDSCICINGCVRLMIIIWL